MTEAQVVSLTGALRTAGVDHNVEKLGADSYRVTATSGILYTAAQLTNLETAHGVTARTNRAVFS